MTQDCFHCSETIPSDVRVTAHLESGDAAVCCIGCKAAAEFVDGAGLANFYQYRETLGANSLKPSLSGFESFDQSSVLDQFSVLFDGNVREATIHVGNMYCSACVWLLQNVFSQQTGILEFSANPSSHNIVLRWDQDLLPFSQILSRIDALGFVPEPMIPGVASETERSDYRTSLQRLIVASVFGMQAMMFAIALYAGDAYGMQPEIKTLLHYVSLAVTLPIIIFSAKPFFQGAVRGVRQLSPGMDVPVSLALVIAFIISVWATFTQGENVYFDSIAMFVLFLSLSRFLEMRARHRSDNKIQAMATLLPKTVIRLAADNQTESVPLSSLAADDRILVRPGDILPADGWVESGEAAVDESFMTGEAAPINKRPDSQVLAGSQCVQGTLHIRLSKIGASTRLAEIARLMEKSLNSRSAIRNWADRLSTGFVSAVLLLAMVTGIVWWMINPGEMIEPVLAVLIVSCPCALALATPAVMAVATSTLSKMGLLLVNSRILQCLNTDATLIFDKTGTLTCGKPKVAQTELLPTAGNMSKEDCLDIAATLEAASEHVLARAFQNNATPKNTAENTEVIVGQGVSGTVNGHDYRIGSLEFVMELSGPAPQDVHQSHNSTVFLGNGNGFLAKFTIQDVLRPDTAATLRQLKRQGFQIIIASGDRDEVVSEVARQLKIEKWYGGMSPADKVQLIQSQKALGNTTIMIGDGINDAPVLTSADASIALDAGTALARASADAVLLSDRIRVLSDLTQIAKRTRGILRQNIIWAISYNLLGVSLAALGILTPWMAAIGMSISSLLVVGNALRLSHNPDQVKSQTAIPQQRLKRMPS